MLAYQEKSSSSNRHPKDPVDTPLEDPFVVTLPQRRPGSANPCWKIPSSEWPTVLRRIEQGESLRKVARDYHVSYEVVRRVIRLARHCSWVSFRTDNPCSQHRFLRPSLKKSAG